MANGPGKIGVGVVAAGVVAALAYFGTRAAFPVAPPPDIPDRQWQPLHVPGRCQVRLPGPPSRQEQALAGVVMVTYSAQPDRDLVFAVAYTEGPLPPPRLRLPAATVLDDSCDGTVTNLASLGGRERQREAIWLGPVPGKQLTVELPSVRGKMFTRCYLAGGRLYLATCGGRGVEADQANVRRFFDSFEILDDAKASAAGGPP